MDKGKAKFLRGSFPITSISRIDLEGLIGEEKAALFTDDDMRRLADKMANDYLEQLYWTSAQILAEYVLEEIEKRGEEKNA